MIIRKTIRVIFTVLGGGMLGIILHEAYHYFTLDKVSIVCWETGGDTIAFVRGTGNSSEIIAYIITGICLLIGMSFALYDLFKEEN